MSRAKQIFRILLKLALGVACVAGAMALYRFLLHPQVASALSLGSEASSMVRRTGLFLVLVLSYWGFVRFYERRAATELRLPMRWILLAAVGGSLSIGVTILTLYATGSYQLLAVRGLGPAAGALGVLWIAATIEEVMFRGFLFRILEEGLGTGWAAATTALIFSVVHLSNNGARWITLFSVLLAGLMWTLVFIVSRNLWVATAHHCCWNATIFAVGLPLSGEEFRPLAPLVTVSHGSILWTGGAFGPEDSLVNIVVSAVLCAALWRLALRVNRRVQRDGSPETGLPSTILSSGELFRKA